MKLHFSREWAAKKIQELPDMDEPYVIGVPSMELKENNMSDRELWLDRKVVYAAVDSERDYQDLLWAKTLSGARPGDGSRTVDEFATYINSYNNDLQHIAGHFGDEDQKLEVVRKIAALAVACMEQHGAPFRKIPDTKTLETRRGKQTERE